VPRAQLAEIEIRRLNSELEAANQNLAAFTYSVAHDLRAPLRHIGGYVDILQSTVSQTLDQTGRKHLQTIAQSVARMGQMFDALLDFTRAGAAEMHFQQVSLASLVKDAQRDLFNETQGRVISWKIGDLPKVRGDPEMLREVIVNLLSNAVKFTRARRNAKIEIGVKNSSRETICFVRDNGVGFDMNCAAKLFGLFQRLHPASEFEGVGIGLAKVRRLVQRHGGETWAKSKLGQGATFYLSVPNPAEGAV